jgi:DNA transformation protein and related proteins
MPWAPHPLAEFICDQLSDWAPVTPRRFFSGAAICRGDVIFGIIIRDTIYFRTDDINRVDYENLGMNPFRYERPGRKVTAMAYHELPADILEDSEQLAQWAAKAYDAAHEVAQKKLAKKPTKPAAKSKPAKKTVRAKPVRASLGR